MDNDAITRIAAPDLAADTLALLEKYRANDDVIFFLGRLVWQGEMESCAPILFEIATDPARGRYARTAAIRGVLAGGSAELKDKLWNAVADQPGTLDHAILSEFLYRAAPTSTNIELLLRSLERAAPYNRYHASSLLDSLHGFIDRLPVMANSAVNHPLGQFIKGMNALLTRAPFVARSECYVSQEFMWLMPAALHAVDRLVAAQSAEALKREAIAVLDNAPALRYWNRSHADDYKTSLPQNVPRWRELNDVLYWASIEACRTRMAAKGLRLVDDWKSAYIGHFWRFGPEDFERCLGWVESKAGDNRYVALSRCLQIYADADRPSAWLARLRAAVADDAALTANLEAHLKPNRASGVEEIDAEHQRWERENDARDREAKKDRADWVRALRANPGRVLNPPGLKPGEFSNDQYYLLGSIESGGVSTSRETGANWRALIPEFGTQVAEAFRDAALAHWRAYQPMLRSEGGDADSIPYSLVFAMTGLAIEASEDTSFGNRLTEDEARLAFRYSTWELNGFPSWFESLYRAFPNIGRDAVTKEVKWELEQSVGERPVHYILHDILYHAPWLHGDVAPVILEWLHTNNTGNADALRYCLNILTGSGAEPSALAALAANKVRGATPTEQKPRWFALWVDTDPAAAIPALERILNELAPADASAFAQQFVVDLLGDRHGTGTRLGAYRNAHDLKTLYVLVHRHIRIADDIDRTGKGAYSPTLRDNAQHGRDTLFNLLVAVPGPDTYAAIKELATEHPEPDHRYQMARQARQRATQDADEPPWTIQQVRDLSEYGVPHRSSPL